MKLLPRFLRDIIREKKQKIRHKRRIAAFDKIIEAFLDSKTPGTLYALNHNNRIAGGGSNAESQDSNPQSQELIISLTSYPKRIPLIHHTLHSLLTQTHKPHRVVLYLTENEFPNKEQDLPAKLLAFCECGLEIAFVQGNLKSYNKFIHTLQDFKDSIIVTADDDVIYSPNWLKLLYDAYLEEPQFIHCHRAHRISFDSNGEIRPYQQWQSSILYTQTIPSYLNFFTGVGGVLYPPHCLHEDILKQDLFLKLCPSADDIWFFAMALLKGTKINVVKDNIPTLNDVDWDGNHDLALYHTNLFGGANDKQLANVMTHYPQLKEKIRFDSDEYWEIRYKSHTDEVMGGGA